MRSFFASLAALFISFAAGAQSFPPTPRVLVAVNPITNKVYTVNEFANSVTVLDAANDTTKTIAVGSRPQFIAVNPLTNRIYVNNGGEASLTVIDGTTDTNITPTPLAIGSQGPMAINAETNIVYIVRMTSLATDEVTFFNGSTNTWYTIATESFQPTALTINPFTNTLYVAHYGTGDVRIISGAFDPAVLHPTTFSIGAWSKPFAIAANPSTNKIYVITEDPRGPIGIIDGATRTAVFPVPASGHASQPKAIAVNPVTNRIYAVFANEVVVINGNTNAYTYIPVATGSGQSGVAINSITNKIYVSSIGGTLTVIDGDTNTTSTVAIPSGAESIGANPVTNEVIVHGPTPTFVQGSSLDVEHGTNVTTNITPLAGDTSGPNPTITVTASNSSSNPLPIRGVFYQLDSREGAWRAAEGSGPYTVRLSGLSPGSHTLHTFAIEGQVVSIATGPQSAPLTGRISKYTFNVTGGATLDPRVSLASSQNPSSIGASVTFTASVTGSGGTPTGTVRFTDGANTIGGCSAVALTGGSAACSTSALSSGGHTINATYLGDATYRTASASLTQAVNLLTPEVSLGSSANPSTSGQALTFTASVSGSGAAPTGTVNFTEGGVSLSGCGAVTIAAGTATCTTSTLAVGSHSIDARYSGNATYTAKTSTVLSQTVQEAPPPGPSTNVALAANGGSASASSTGGSSFPVSSLINGDRAGANWGSGGGWKDGTQNAFPDWVQIDFNASQTIDRVVVYSLQDTPTAPVEPGDTTTFANYGVTDFVVEAWNGSAWVSVATVSGNTLVKRTVTFTPVSTQRIRVTITGVAAAANGYSRLIEVEAWTPGTPPPPPSTNVALATAGAVASASSMASASFPVSSLIDGDRAGANWGSGGGWKDATQNAFPDWVQVDFNAAKTIDRVVVYSLQDMPGAAVEPSDTTTFASYGVTDFVVEAWNGSAWVNLASVGANNLVKRTVTFTAVTTQRIRVTITGLAPAANGYSRLIEVEAWTPGTPPPPPPPANVNVALAANGGTASASSTGGASFPVSSLIDGDGAGMNWGNGGGWKDATQNVFPDWVQVDFNAAKTIDRIVVYSLQDMPGAPVEPSDTTTFSSYGVTDFVVEAWNGSAWVTLATVGGNNLVKRTVSFTAVTTQRIRVSIMGLAPAANGYSRLVEVEAWGH